MDIKSGTLQLAATTGNGTPFEVSGFSDAVFTVIGSAGADRVVNWEASQDGVNYAGVMATPLATGTAALTTTVTGTTAILVRLNVAALRLVRARLSGGAAGTATVTGTAYHV